MEFDKSKINVAKDPVTLRCIGIMADSHGQAHKIVAALEFLCHRGCDSLYHLGDICDSGHPETVEACVRPLQQCGVLAIKGNNDHQIDVNHRDQRNSLIPHDTLEFIRQLPLVRNYPSAVLTHSLPFAQELGLSSMIGVMGEMQINHFLRAYPHRILFRGHSHNPEIFRKQGGKIICQTLRIGQQFDLTDSMPCVVTCGALTRDLCMIWRPHENVIECLRFNKIT